MQFAATTSILKLRAFHSSCVSLVLDARQQCGKLYTGKIVLMDAMKVDEQRE